MKRPGPAVHVALYFSPKGRAYSADPWVLKWVREQRQAMERAMMFGRAI